MITNIKHSKIKIESECKCSMCNYIIPAGSIADYYEYSDENGYHTLILHKDCNVIFKTIQQCYQADIDEISSEDFIIFTTDIIEKMQGKPLPNIPTFNQIQNAANKLKDIDDFMGLI